MDQNDSQKVVFEEISLSDSQYSSVPIKGITGLVVKYSNGMVKDEVQANYVILGIVAIAITLTLLIIFSSGSKTEIVAPSGYRVINIPGVPPKLEKR